MGDRAGFRASLARFLRFMVPVSCVNALLKYATKELSLGLRERLTAHLQVGGWVGWLVDVEWRAHASHQVKPTPIRPDRPDRPDRPNNTNPYTTKQRHQTIITPKPPKQ